MIKTQNVLSKEWVDRKYILENYPIGEKTYKKKLKILDADIYKGYTFMGPNNKRYVHQSILDTIFLSKRVPNYNQPHQIRKWVQKQRWNYTGNFTPKLCDLQSNKYLVNEFFKILKSELDDFVFFYSFERNPDQKLYHTHFLIQTTHTIDEEKLILQIQGNKLLKEFLFPDEIKTNPRFILYSYDHAAHGLSGVNYCFKDQHFGLLKSY